MDKKSIVEAMLFASGQKIKLNKIKSIVDVTKKEAETLINEIKQEYIDRKSGLRIIKLSDGYQMTTAKEAYPFLKELFEKNNDFKFTQALLETLSIIAYNQPVTNKEIDAIRGVSSAYCVNKLIEKNVIEEVGRLEKPGNPILFGTTDEFLRCFGFESVNDIENYRKQLELKIDNE